MKITIEKTDELVELDFVQVRLWKGVTDAGTPCDVFVHRIAVHKDHDQNQFIEELREQPSPERAEEALMRFPADGIQGAS